MINEKVWQQEKRKKDVGRTINREIEKISPDRAPGRATTIERKKVGITFRQGRITHDLTHGRK
jgi:hypothetical protein